MTTSSSISEQVRRRSVVPVESTIPPEMTIEQWRSSRRVPCHHLHDSTTCYDRVAKLFSFLLVCTVCGTARVVETLRYEPRFIPRATAAGATPSRAVARSR
jgi:hypothetical protein